MTVAFLFLIAFAGQALAANSDTRGLANGQDVLFVDRENSACSDSYSRTQALSGSTPWCSVDEAIQNMRDGDTVYVFGGTYRGYYVISGKSYSSETKITAYPGEYVVLTSAKSQPESTPNNVWSSYDSGRNIYRTSLSSDTDIWWGAYTDSGLSLFAYNRDFSMQNSYSDFSSTSNPEGIYYDPSANYLYIRLSNNRNPNNWKISISDQPVFTVENVNGPFEISGFHIRDSERGIVVRGSEDIVLDGNFIRGGFKGIDFRTSNDVVISNNEVYMNTNSVWTWQDDLKASAMETSGLWLQRMNENVEVYGNEVHGHFNGIMTYSDNDRSDFSGIKVHDNTIYNINDDAIEIEVYCNGGRYYDNFIYDAFVGFSLSPVDASQNRCYIDHNVIVADKQIKWDDSGTKYYGHCYKIVDGSATRNLQITSNTCVGQGVFTTESETRNQMDVTWKDNIFYSNDERLIDKSGLASDGVVYDYNLYYRTDGGSIFRFWNSDSDRTEYSSLSSALSSSRAPSNWDRHSKQANPQFTSASSYDFKPKQGSPACTMSSSGSYVGAISCGASCGDGTCNGDETCSNCATDCGSCSSANYLWLEAEYPDSITSPMQSYYDPTASADYYLMATSGSGGDASYEFSVERANTFYIWGRVYAPDGDHNSFTFSLGNYQDEIWDIELESDYSWQRLTRRDDGGTSYSLGVGNYELLIGQRESNSRLDKLVITSDQNFVPTGEGEAAENYAQCGDGTCSASESCSSCAADCGTCPPVCGDGTCDSGETCSSCQADCGTCLVPEYHWLEAEFPDNLVSPMSASYDQSASGSYYISVPGTSGSNGEANFEFNIGRKGDYTIWGRVKAPDGERNSFYCMVDDSDVLIWHIDVASGYTWQQLRDSEDNPYLFALESGSHDLVLEQREYQTQIDKILITNVKTYVPSGSGYTAENLPSCGDNVCDITESCTSCSSDCGTCPLTCGDGTCSATESCFSCAADCGTCQAFCGDGTCDAGEDCNLCSQDCGTCTTCGDGTCDSGESCSSCSKDCGSCSSGGGGGGSSRSSSPYPTTSAVQTTKVQMEDGAVEFIANINERAYFETNSETHSFTLIEVNPDSIKFQLRSELVEDTLQMLEEKTYYVDNSTLKITLLAVGDDNAGVMIEEICEEPLVAPEPVIEQPVEPIQYEEPAPEPEPQQEESPLSLVSGNTVKNSGTGSWKLLVLVLISATVLALYFGYDNSRQVYIGAAQEFRYMIRSLEIALFWCVDHTTDILKNISPKAVSFVKNTYSKTQAQAKSIITGLNKPGVKDISSMNTWVKSAYKNGLDDEFIKGYMLSRGWDNQSIKQLLKDTKMTVKVKDRNVENLVSWYDYIRTHLNKGFELDQIREHLIENLGYDEHIIEFIFRSFQKRGIHG